jgi:hypothetical protein
MLSKDTSHARDATSTSEEMLKGPTWSTDGGWCNHAVSCRISQPPDALKCPVPECYTSQNAAEEAATAIQKCGHEKS